MFKIPKRTEVENNMKKIIILIGFALILILSIFLVFFNKKETLDVKSYELNDKYVYLITNNSDDTINVYTSLNNDTLKETCENLFPNNQGVIIIKKNKDHKISDYNFYTKKIDSVTQFTDYDTNTTINYTDEKKISIDLIKDVDDNKRYDGYISILLYDKNKLVDVINKKTTLLDLKTNKTFDIDPNVNDFKLICRFWEN